MFDLPHSQQERFGITNDSFIKLVSHSKKLEPDPKPSVRYNSSKPGIPQEPEYPSGN
jgi:hypothetical protein